MATPPGFEPGLTGPEPVVLPLHHGVVLRKKRIQLLCFHKPVSY